MTGRSYRIAVIPGDGIGPEVTEEALKVLEAASGITGFGYELKRYPYGADHYLSTGELVPDSAIEECRGMDAVFLGAIGDPRVQPGILERGIILKLRFSLDLYVNLRPIVLYAEHLTPIKDKRPEDIDIAVVRENTEDAYAGIGGIMKRGTPDEVAIAEMVYTRKGVERVIRYAFELARARNKKKKVTLVDKANVILAHELWSRVFEEVGEEYPDVEKDHAYIDAACMWMVKNPEWFDVMVTTNIFGDIITDLGAMVQGGMGAAASGNLHPGKVSMFEPIHGSAPKYTGKNVINPVAAIGAMGMLLEYIGEGEASRLVDDSLRALLTSRRIPSLGANCGRTTSEIGDMVVEEMKRRAGSGLTAR